MATAEEKQALGLSPDASDQEVKDKIAELSSAADAASAQADAEIQRLQKEAGEQREAREAAERQLAEVQGSSSQESAALRDQVAALRQSQPSSVTGATPSTAAHPVAQTDTR